MREAAGERFNTLELNILATVVIITDQRHQAALDSLKDWGLPADDDSAERWLESPSVLIGTVDQIVETLQMRRKRYGFSYITVFEPLERFAPVVERLAGK